MKYWSVLQEDTNECYLCGKWIENNGQWHHVFNKFAKKNSEKYGYMVQLCIDCHGTGRNGIHGSKEIREMVQIECRKLYSGTDEEFIKEFNMNIGG